MSGSTRLVALIILSLLMLSGCSTRSISNTNPRDNYSYYGELQDSDVLSAAPQNKVIDDKDIQHALANAKKVLHLPEGSSILLIQSGAIMPDVEMQEALKQHYNIAAYSGVPPRPENKTDYPRLLRLTAANGGKSHILVYWGILESGSENEVTKVVSWVPLIGGVLPDETQHMRIVLRVALIDVASGQWTMFTPKAFENSSISGRYNRDAQDTRQIMELKANAYQAAADDIYQHFSK